MPHQSKVPQNRPDLSYWWLTARRDCCIEPHRDRPIEHRVVFDPLTDLFDLGVKTRLETFRYKAEFAPLDIEVRSCRSFPTRKQHADKQAKK